MDKKRKELIDRFQKWLDTNPRKQIIAAQCATIAEEYHKEQLKLYGVISCKNKDEAFKRLKLLRKVKNDYESKDLMVTKKYMIKQIKKHLTNAFWHGWHL